MQKFIPSNWKMNILTTTKKCTKVNYFYSVFFNFYLFSGITYSYQKNHMSHADYKDSLFHQDHNNIKLAKTVHFTSKHHKVYTVEREKKYLIPYVSCVFLITFLDFRITIFKIFRMIRNTFSPLQNLYHMDTKTFQIWRQQRNKKLIISLNYN